METCWRARARRVTIICQQRARIVRLGGKCRFLTITDKETDGNLPDTTEHDPTIPIPLRLDGNTCHWTQLFRAKRNEKKKKREKQYRVHCSSVIDVDRYKVDRIYPTPALTKPLPISSLKTILMQSNERASTVKVARVTRRDDSRLSRPRKPNERLSLHEARLSADDRAKPSANRSSINQELLLRTRRASIQKKLNWNWQARRVAAVTRVEPYISINPEKECSKKIDSLVHRRYIFMRVYSFSFLFFFFFFFLNTFSRIHSRVFFIGVQSKLEVAEDSKSKRLSTNVEETF